MKYFNSLSLQIRLYKLNQMFIYFGYLLDTGSNTVYLYITMDGQFTSFCVRFGSDKHQQFLDDLRKYYFFNDLIHKPRLIKGFIRKVIALCELNKCLPFDKVHIFTEVKFPYLKTFRKIDAIIYVADKLCIAIEYKSHLAKTIKLTHKYQARQQVRLITRQLREITWNNGTVQIPLYGILLDCFFSNYDKCVRVQMRTFKSRMNSFDEDYKFECALQRDGYTFVQYYKAGLC